MGQGVTLIRGTDKQVEFSQPVTRYEDAVPVGESIK